MDWQIVAELDYLHYCLDGIIGRPDVRSPLDRLIDKVTGFEVQKDKKKIKEVLFILRQIRTRKKKLDMDVSLEKKTIKELKELQKARAI